MYCALLDQGPWPTLTWVEIRSSIRIPGMSIIGLPGPAVIEARERVRAAMEACDYRFPNRRIIVNLAPASLRKQATGVDLAIALSLVLPDTPHRVAAWAELGLDGGLRPVGSLARMLVAAADSEITRVIVADEEALEARRIGAWLATHYPRAAGLEIVAAKSLREAVFAVTGAATKVEPLFGREFAPLKKDWWMLGMSEGLQRVLLAAVAGRHHLLLLGPKGTGKTKALEVARALLPPADSHTMVRERMLAELEDPHRPLSTGDEPPVRELGCDIRPQTLMGTLGRGGVVVRPGELTRAHGGAIIANEFLEWSRDSREILREPLEAKVVNLVRAGGSVSLPADFLLLASSNPCACGEIRCRCRPGVRARYLNRLSGPILDRIDLSYIVAEQNVRTKVDLAAMRDKIANARNLMMNYHEGISGQLTPEHLETVAENFGEMSLRSRHAITRVAMTLAALDNYSLPTNDHFFEAKTYRAEITTHSCDPPLLG